MAICMIELAVFIGYVYFKGNEAWTWFAFNTGFVDLGSDYFRHVTFSASGPNLYEVAGDQGFFPPLSYLFYYFFLRLSTADSSLAAWSAVDNSEAFLFVYIVYLLVSVFIMYFAVESFLRGKSHKSVFLCIIASAIFLGSALIAGNTVLNVFPMILVSLDWKDSDSKIKRELALLLIAIAAGFKIYPAIFGFLYVKERRWKETIRLIIYGFVLFFAPFVAFGGVHGALVMFKHIAIAMYYIEFGRIQYIRGVAVYIMTLITGDINSRLVNRVALYSPMIFIVVMFVLGMTSKDKIRTIFFFTAAMIFFPTNAYRYSLTMMTVPFLFWVRENSEKLSTENWITSLLYSGLYAVPMLFGVCSGFGGHSAEWYTLSYVEFWLYGCAYALLLYEIGLEIRTIPDRICSNRKTQED